MSSTSRSVLTTVSLFGLLRKTAASSPIPITVDCVDEVEFASHPLQIAPKRIEPGFDGFDRSGKGEAQVAFAFCAKDDARHRRHLRAIEQHGSSFATVFVDTTHIWKCVERAGGRSARQTDLIQS